MSDTVADVRTYELMVLATPDLGDKEVEELLERIRSLIKSKDGKMLFEEVWGKRRLMYRIKKQDQGIYIVMNFTAVPGEIPEMEQTIRLDHQVMRHLLITVPNNYEMRSYKEDSQLARRVMPGKVDMATMEQPVAPKRAPRKDVVAEIVAEKAALGPKAEETPAKPAAKKVTRPKIDKLEDIDAKLSSIIDDPDIKL